MLVSKGSIILRLWIRDWGIISSSQLRIRTDFEFNFRSQIRIKTQIELQFRLGASSEPRGSNQI